MICVVEIWLAIGIPRVLSAMDKDSSGVEIAFASDTQAPMWIEERFLRSNQNRKATAMVFSAIQQRKPKALYLLGDVVSLGYSNRKWVKVDECVNNCRTEGIDVYALMGNHDVMGRARKGERNFQKRFPQHVRTGYVSVTDSVAVILLNSNFGGLPAADQDKQKAWYESTLSELDDNPAVKVVIVTCHHPPYTNSKLVASSKAVQQQFVPAYVKSEKARLFITGHSHAFEHFHFQNKDFLIIGGGGGLNHPLNTSTSRLQDMAPGYKPNFHYLIVQRGADKLKVTSYYLQNDFSGFDKGYTFEVPSL